MRISLSCCTIETLALPADYLLSSSPPHHPFLFFSFFYFFLISSVHLPHTVLRLSFIWAYSPKGSAGRKGTCVACKVEQSGTWFALARNDERTPVRSCPLTPEVGFSIPHQRLLAQCRTMQCVSLQLTFDL